MGRTLLDKIWDAHTVRTEEGGRTVLYIDRQYIHEVTSPVAFAGLARRGVGVVHPDRRLLFAQKKLSDHQTAFCVHTSVLVPSKRLEGR